VRWGEHAARRASLAAFVVVGLVGAPERAAHAEDLRAHASLGVSHALGLPQSREFGWGGSGSASVELPLGRAVGLEGKLGAVLLSEGDPPRDPRFLRTETGTAFLATGGLRVRPFTAVAGPWLSAGLGFVQTGDRARFAVDTALGWDVRVSKRSRVDLGPYVGFADLVQADDGLRPNDAYLFSIGLHVGLGVAAPPPPPPGDRDGDRILDPDDACPDVPGIPTGDPLTHGCPRRDRDRDGVFDDEDACPDLPGIRTADPKTNGCPRPDRDQDGVYDDEDACPDRAGPRTSDPQTNGCPRQDRDNDEVFDDEDACPDVPGVRTIDPKTNGCPPAGDSVRVEKDRILLDDVILFDLDSPRVRHASWPLVKKLADFILATPEIQEVSIEGHADATGTVAHNLVLSRERAESVRRLLLQNGVDAARVKAEAFGRSRLKVETARAEQKNRRVEFWITRTRTGTVAPPSGAPVPLSPAPAPAPAPGATP